MSGYLGPYCNDNDEWEGASTSTHAPPVHVAAPLARFLEILADRLDADERRGLAAEGDRESDPADWPSWTDNFRIKMAG